MYSSPITWRILQQQETLYIITTGNSLTQWKLLAIPLTRISQKIGKSTCIQTVRTSLKSIGPIKILFIYYYSPINSDSNGRIGDQLR